jgi:hypothetical protein
LADSFFTSQSSILVYSYKWRVQGAASRSAARLLKNALMSLVFELIHGLKKIARATTHSRAALCAAVMLQLVSVNFVCAQDPPTQPVAVSSGTQAGAQIRGLVGSGGMAVPGATVVAVNTANGAESTTTTDFRGAYTLRLPGPGPYTVKLQMTAFAPATRQVTVTDTAQPAQADFQLILLSRAREGQAQANAPRSRPTGRGMMGGGMASAFEQPSSPGTAAELVPQGMQVPGMNANSATESVAFSGNTTTSQFAGLSLAEMQQRMREMREERPGFQQGGGPGGPPPGGGMGGAASTSTTCTARFPIRSETRRWTLLPTL